jgi:hypothetical protein
MFLKLITLTCLLFAVAIGLLLMRHERLGLSNEAANLHANLQAQRQRVWEAQVTSAQLLPPDKLRQRIVSAGLRLEPWMIPAQPVAIGHRVVQRQFRQNRTLRP